jgi:hypothetical protein
MNFGTSRQRGRVSVGTAQDYATLEAAGFDCYYGYECEDQDGEWGFVANLPNDGRIRFSNAELRAANPRLKGSFPSCAGMLLTGIGLMLEALKESGSIDFDRKRREGEVS